MDREKLEQSLAELPLYAYFEIDPKGLEFSSRVRFICENECPMYGKSWACPPGVGAVEDCKEKCLSYEKCLLIGTITEVADIADIQSSLDTRHDHEALTNAVRGFFREQGVDPYILSTEACAHCARCTVLDNEPCRFPERMHPCLESHGINIIPTLEENGLEFYYGTNIVTWYSLFFYND